MKRKELRKRDRRDKKARKRSFFDQKKQVGVKKKEGAGKVTVPSTKTGPLSAPKWLDAPVDQLDETIEDLEAKLLGEDEAERDSKRLQLEKEMQEDGLDQIHSILDNLGNVSEEQSEDSEEDEDGIDDEDWDNVALQSEMESELSAENDDDSDHVPEVSEAEMQRRKEEYTQKALVRQEKQKQLYGGSTATPKTGYVPPHLRNRDDTALAKLKRTIKGLLNRVSHDTLTGIAQSIVDLMHEPPRDAGKSDIIDSFVSSCLDFARELSVSSSSTMLLHHVAIGVRLHSLFPESNCSSVLMERIVDELHHTLQQTMSIETKEQYTRRSASLVAMLCHTYSLELLDSVLIYDLLDSFVSNTGFVQNESLTELRIELILHIVQTCGFQLRRDDPSRLKAFITTVRKMELERTNRVLFLFDAIEEVRLNRNKESGTTDTIRATKKWLSSLIGAQLPQPLSVPIMDVVNRHTNGRWWVVGGVWKGRETKHVSHNVDIDDSFGITQQLLELAKNQHMSTPKKQRIFCIVMGSEDYIDAFAKLMRLGLKRSEERRDIIRVIIHCCSQERVYNQYYLHLLVKLCDVDRSHRFTLQLLYWDFFKLLSDPPRESPITKEKVFSLAQLLADLMSKFVLSLSMLKIVNFDMIQRKQHILFFHVLFKLLATQKKETAEGIFSRIALKPALKRLRDGIDLFCVRHVLPYYASGREEQERIQEARNVLSRRVDSDTL